MLNALLNVEYYWLEEFLSKEENIQSITKSSGLKREPERAGIQRGRNNDCRTFNRKLYTMLF